MGKKFLLLFCLSAVILGLLGCTDDDYITLIQKGDFKLAEKVIRRELARNEHLSWRSTSVKFELDRMDRIRLDFDQSEEEVVKYIRQYIPEVSPADLARWENEKKLEYMVIDGKKLYFSAAARNLFRLDKAAKAIKQKVDSTKAAVAPESGLNLDEHCQKVIDAVVKTKKSTVLPVRMQITQSIAVNPNVVPGGQNLRCWIPFPRRDRGRQ
jgi:hypothetical protein